MELYDYIQQSIKPVPIENTMGRVYEDRHSDFTADSRLWIELFMIVDKENRELADVLMYIRGTGAILTPDQTFGYVIQPVIDPSGRLGWVSQQQYEKERQYLLPYANLLIESLKELRRRYDQKLIIW
ncbi:MAG: hypothetical protein E6713_02910 [Sporomusaceae bacterium]|nr:hypothetical protein [Sporomusaceae bacterium]